MKKGMNNFYLYQHMRLDRNEVFYIGIGSQPNYKRAYVGSKKRNNFWTNITNKTNYEVQILRDNLSKELACKFECALIAFYGRLDNRTGQLCNLTNGGEGVYGHINSAALKLKKSISKMGELNPNFGKKASEETKNKMSKSKTGFLSPRFGIKMSSESKIKLSINRRGKGVGSRHHCSKVVFNLETGIFYESIIDATPSYMKTRTFSAQLTGQNPNRTNFILV